MSLRISVVLLDDCEHFRPRFEGLVRISGESWGFVRICEAPLTREDLGELVRFRVRLWGIVRMRFAEHHASCTSCLKLCPGKQNATIEVVLKSSAQHQGSISFTFWMLYYAWLPYRTIVEKASIG